MPNPYFQFKQFTIYQDRCAMKVTTDACLFGAWVATETGVPESEAGLVLDVGSGTGLLTLMVAQKNPKAVIDAIEIDNDAVKQAKENISSSPYRANVNVINADARTFQFPKNYDIIISNPPFYEKEIRSAKDSKNIAHHSDQLGLEELLTIVKRQLSPGGSFFLLLPFKRNEEIKKLFKDHQLHIHKIVFVRQSLKHDYFRIMLKGSLHQKENEQTEFDEISIRDNEQKYTEEFVRLLKDYYLNL